MSVEWAGDQYAQYNQAQRVSLCTDLAHASPPTLLISWAPVAVVVVRPVYGQNALTRWACNQEWALDFVHQSLGKELGGPTTGTGDLQETGITGDVLDVGCGDGSVSAWIATRKLPVARVFPLLQPSTFCTLSTDHIPLWHLTDHRS
jgi:hypothetical protein